MRCRLDAARPAGDHLSSRGRELCPRDVRKSAVEACGPLAEAAAVVPAPARRTMAPEAERFAIELMRRAMRGIDQRPPLLGRRLVKSCLFAGLSRHAGMARLSAQ